MNGSSGEQGAINAAVYQRRSLRMYNHKLIQPVLLCLDCRDGLVLMPAIAHITWYNNFMEFSCCWFLAIRSQVRS